MNFELVAVVDSQTYWFNEQGINPNQVATHFQDEALPNQEQSWLKNSAH